MAYNVSNLSNYIGRENQILTKALFAGGDTMKFATLMTGVKGSTTVPHLSGNATLQAGSCPTPSGTTTATEVTLTVKPFTVYEQFCADDLESKFPNTIIAPGSNNGDSLKPWEEQLIDVKVSSIAEQLELTYWQGTLATGSYQLFDGFIDIIDTAATAIDGNTASVTSGTGIIQGNVKAIVDAIYVAAPAKVKRSGEFTIMVGDDVFDLYIAAEKAANLYHYAPEHNDGVYNIGGSRGTLQRVYGLDGTDRIFAGQGSNFIVGADVADEDKVADVFYDQTLDKVQLRVKGKSGVAVANIDEIVEFTLA